MKLTKTEIINNFKKTKIFNLLINIGFIYYPYYYDHNSSNYIFFYYKDMIFTYFFNWHGNHIISETQYYTLYNSSGCIFKADINKKFEDNLILLEKFLFKYFKKELRKYKINNI